ncbi:MAG: cbb3-type cytochrome c oxidase subunit I, partial [Alphaproteobacteria bacterium]|nr:cbb3-type cytochrome c oxidase subunit I [Alphaproteobacteria bacterium]
MASAARTPAGREFSDIIAGIGLVLGALIGLFLAARATDGIFEFHAWLMVAACVVGAIYIANNASEISAGRRTAPDGTAYNETVIKAFVIATMFWGVAGFLVGDTIAWQLAFPALNFDWPYTTFSRLRPLHTSAVIFAFGGNVLIGTSFYVVQRTCRTRLAGNWAPWFVFWGYNLFIVIAGTGYLFGVTQSKEYAEPEWYADLWLTIVWVTYLLVFLATLMKRREPHIYVANWFYLAFIVTIAMLHIVNNVTVPVSWTGSKSYIAWSGVQDAMIQWWYGHNAVG